MIRFLLFSPLRVQFMQILFQSCKQINEGATNAKVYTRAYFTTARLFPGFQPNILLLLHMCAFARAQSKFYGRLVHRYSAYPPSPPLLYGRSCILFPGIVQRSQDNTLLLQCSRFLRASIIIVYSFARVVINGCKRG